MLLPQGLCIVFSLSLGILFSILTCLFSKASVDGILPHPAPDSPSPDLFSIIAHINVLYNSGSQGGILDQQPQHHLRSLRKMQILVPFCPQFLPTQKPWMWGLAIRMLSSPPGADGP